MLRGQIEREIANGEPWAEGNSYLLTFGYAGTGSNFQIFEYRTFSELDAIAVTSRECKREIDKKILFSRWNAR